MYFLNLDKTFKKRMDFGKFMNFDNNCFDILTSFFPYKLSNLKVQGEYLVQSDEKKPDLISHRIYGDTQYWWILMLYNSVFDPQDVVTGLVLKYPSINDIEKLYLSLKSEEVKNLL